MSSNFSQVVEHTKQAIHIPERQRGLVIAILNLAMRRKGQMVGFLWLRDMKTRKTTVSKITKEVRTVCRVGLDYDNQKAVQEKREEGELPAQNAGLPWGKWFYFPYLIEHKGNLYFRLYPLPNHTPKVIYRINGQIARKEEIEPLCLASEFYEKETHALSININNLCRMR